MRSIFISLSLLFILLSVQASRTWVSTAMEINAGSWKAGDTIVMRNGTWTDQSISFRAEGSAEMPVVLMAESPGKVILTGSSKLAFSGNYIHVSGLYFKDGNLSDSDVIAFRTRSYLLAENCRVSNTCIENYNPPDNMNETRWVSVYGKENQVDHCSFVNKANQGTLLVVWLKEGVIPDHIIDHNYFGYRIPNLDEDGEELNSQEIIRIGDSETSMLKGGVRVSNNFFEHCNGETEVISNKSCENTYSNNLLFECAGMIALRHGNGCTVEGNYFFGSRINNTGGVRIMGEDHRVYNNYFEKLKGRGFRAAICIVRGKENSKLNEYFQVKNTMVMFNTMVDCRQSFSINYNSSSKINLPPVGTTIAHNHVYNSTAKDFNVIIYPVNVGAMDVTWKNNIMNQGIIDGFSYTPDEIITGMDPSMVRSGTVPDIFEPHRRSILRKYSVNEFPEVRTDIRGRGRKKRKIPGASELSGKVQREMPSRENTGAYFFTPGNTPD